MAMNSTTKRKLNKQVTRVAALAMTCVIGISSAFTVAALTKKITVVDGDNQIAVSTLNTNTDKVLELAVLRCRTATPLSGMMIWEPLRSCVRSQ